MFDKAKSLYYRLQYLRLPEETQIQFLARLYHMTQRFIASRGGNVSREDVKAVQRVLKSGKIAYGAENRRFEAEFAEAYQAAGAVTSSSGTAALHTAMAMVDVGPGDEVVVPPITDIGSILPVLLRNAIPIFADVDPETWNIDPSAVEAVITPRTRAILAVHLFGNPCDLDRLCEIANRYDLALIEDCAQAHFARYHGKPIGTIGDVGAFSFQWAKHITCGEGGMTISKHADHIREGHYFVDKGRDRSVAGKYRRDLRAHPTFGVNYRLSEMQAAMGRTQLRRGKATMGRRIRCAKILKEALSDVSTIRFQRVHDDCDHSYWQLAFTVDEDAPFTADAVVTVLAKQRIFASAHLINDPIQFTHTPLLERRLYNRSDLPFSLSDRGEALRYDDPMPVTQSVLDRIVVVGLQQVGSTSQARQMGEQMRRAIEGLRHPARPKSSSEFSVGIVGCGAIADEHLTALSRIPEVRVQAIADISDSALKTMGSAFGIEARYQDYETMFAQEKLDIVVVLTWPSLHAPVTKAAALAGIRVIICEKPFASQLGDANAMMDECRKAGSLLVIGHQHRFNPNVELARDLIARGELGTIKRVRAFGPSSLINHGPHTVDAMLFMLGQPKVIAVDGELDRQEGLMNRGQLVEKNCVSRIHFDDGVSAIMKTGEDVDRPMSWEFDGTNGTAAVDLHQVAVTISGHSKTYRRYRVRSMEDQMREVIACLKDSSKWHRGDAVNAYATMEVLMGILESARLGETVEMPVTQMNYPLEIEKTPIRGASRS